MSYASDVDRHSHPEGSGNFSKPQCSCRRVSRGDGRGAEGEWLRRRLRWCMPLAQGLLRERGTCKVQSLIEKSLGNAEDLEPCMNVDCLPLRTVGCRHGVLGKLVVPSEGPETKRRKTSAGEGGQQDHSACCLLSAPPLCAVEPLAWLLSDGRKDSISILGCGAMGSVHLFSSTQRYRARVLRSSRQHVAARYAAFFARAGHQASCSRWCWALDPDHFQAWRFGLWMSGRSTSQ